MCQLLHKYFIIYLTTLLLISCGGGGGGEPGIIDNNEKPVATPEPPTLSYIKGDVPIVITFSQSMDPDELTILDAMTGSVEVWSSVNVENDTLTIAPETRWSETEHDFTFRVKNTTRGEVGPTTLTYTVDDTAPTAVTLPVSGLIENTLAVKITFSESMDRSSIVATNSIWDESDKVWSSSSDSKIDDILTLVPKNQNVWLDGEKGLTIQAKDLAGNFLGQKVYSYTVDSSVPDIVSINFNDEETLLPESSVIIQFTETIDINSVEASGLLWSAAEVIYTTNASTNDTITLKPNTMWSLEPHSLNLDLKDINGNALSTLNLTYSVGCAVGEENCNGQCVDLSSDELNCGECTISCGGAENAVNSVCTSGQCSVAVCDNGFSDCNSDHSDGCEVNTTSNPLNCGTCNNSCTDTISCTNDVCVSSNCNNNPNDSLCGADIIEGWGPCIGKKFSCDVNGKETRTITPKVCDVNGCGDGTQYTETRACIRNTDDDPCIGGTCYKGACKLAIEPDPTPTPTPTPDPDPIKDPFEEPDCGPNPC